MPQTPRPHTALPYNYAGLHCGSVCRCAALKRALRMSAFSTHKAFRILSLNTLITHISFCFVFLQPASTPRSILLKMYAVCVQLPLFAARLLQNDVDDLTVFTLKCEIYCRTSVKCTDGANSFSAVGRTFSISALLGVRCTVFYPACVRLCNF